MRFAVLVTLVALGLACGGNDSARGSGNTGIDGGVVDAGTIATDVVAISLSQTDVHIPVGTMTAFAVTATHRDGSRSDVTQQAQATSSNPAVASVAHGQGSQILITANAPGSATISVSLGTLQQTAAVTVTPK